MELQRGGDSSWRIEFPYYSKGDMELNLDSRAICWISLVAAGSTQSTAIAAESGWGGGAANISPPTRGLCEIWINWFKWINNWDWIWNCFNFQAIKLAMLLTPLVVVNKPGQQSDLELRLELPIE